MSDYTVRVNCGNEKWHAEIVGMPDLAFTARRFTDVSALAQGTIAAHLGLPHYPRVSVVLADTYKPNMALPKTIVCDIDGTLALHDGRGPYEFDKLESDALNAPVGWTLDAYAEMGWTIVLLSGRQEEYRPHTERWLEKYLIPYAELLMRPEGDRRSDDIVKYELFNKIRDRYFVWLVLDDRDRCVYLWRKLGLTAFQVAPGDF